MGTETPQEPAEPYTRLTNDEAGRLHHLAAWDGLTANDYTIGRGSSGHAFAVNGYSMAYDLTAGENIDADTIGEADAIVVEGSR